jgi:hypothetical protein
VSAHFTVTLADESTATVTADRVDVVDGGALVFAAAAEPPPAGMQEIFILSARSWRWCVADGADVSLSNPAFGGAQQTPAPPKPPRMYPAISTPDPLR